MFKRIRIFTGLFLGVCAFAAHADTVYLLDGREINGTIVEDNNATVVVRRENGSMQSFRRSDVDAVVYNTVKRPLSSGVVIAKPEPKPVAAPEVKPAPAESATAPETAAPAVPAPATPATETAASTPPAAPVKAEPAPAKKKEWTAPPGLAGFPDKAPRMAPEKEEQFMNIMAALATVDPNARASAKSALIAMGPEVLPYAIAAAQHTHAEARASAMDAIGNLPNGSAAIKNVIEMMYSALPEAGEPASYQVPYIRAGKSTLQKITGQSFITVEPSSALVQVGMKAAIDWYNANIDRLPKQLTDPELDQTDPDYVKKLKEARKLVLARREWPRPPMPADITAGRGESGRTTVRAQDVINKGDRSYGQTFQPQDRDAATLRGRDGQRNVDPRDAALDRR
jgi:hypothetical protein